MPFVANRIETRMPRAVVSTTRAAHEQLLTLLVSQAIRRVQSGDREGGGFLYVRYADNVYGYVRKIVQDSHEAEDVTQQVFANLINAIGKYEAREVSFLARVLRVARNLAVDYVQPPAGFRKCLSKLPGISSCRGRLPGPVPTRSRR
jgi:hypothetical protein